MIQFEGITRYKVQSNGVSEVHRQEKSSADTESLNALRRQPFSQRLLDNATIKIIESSKDELTFDLIGVDASIANALRRIMLAEVPTMAIEQVYIQMNSSIIHDEVLAHRLGLVPINAHPDKFKDFTGEANSDNTIVFDLDVTCRAPEGRDSSDDAQAPYTMAVHTSELKWMPQGDQSDRFPEGIRPVHEDILLAKMRPGQSIKLEAHCIKGDGKNHAKFSPVATASYRLLPRIKVKQSAEYDETVPNESAARISMFDDDDEKFIGKRRSAVEARPLPCSMVRDITRKPGWSKRVTLEREADHFMFKVEPVGMLSPTEIVKGALKKLKEKCVSFEEALDEVDGSAMDEDEESLSGDEDEDEDVEDML